jgi:ABC-type lipoprotein export system ATPase subunit
MTTSPQWMVEAQDLTRIYGDGEAIRALDGVNFRIAPGEFVSVMGPSGSGKSTLLNLIGALDRPTSGKILVNGEDLERIRSKDRFRAHTVGFVFQLHNLIPTLTARENVEIPMMGHRGLLARKRRAEELLRLVGLGDRIRHLPSQLSGGQRQRVAVARALANDPPLVLADEPTGNLDTASGQELMSLLGELNKTQGTTFMVVTHDLAIARQTHRILVMADGKIVREDIIGSPIEEDLKIWRHSGLGRRIVNLEMESLADLQITSDQAAVVRQVLVQANGLENAAAVSETSAEPGSENL